MTRPKAKWVHTEDVILHKKYRSSSNEEILALLPGKELGQIKSRAYHLGLKRGLQIGMGRSERYKSFVIEPQNVDPEKDVRHVSACLSQGGFPSAQIVAGQTVWVWPKMELAA